MISLRKYLESSAEGLDEPAVTAFRSVLLAIGNCGERAVPGLGVEIDRKMADLGKNLVQPVTSAILASTTQQVEAELAGWARRAVEHHNDIERELSEIIGVVARAAESVGERDMRYARELGDLTGHLSSIAEANDLALVRRSVVESTRALKSCVERMAEDSKSSLLQLTAQVKEYRARLEESERLSATDPLTELPNRRAFEKQLETRVKARQPFCLIMIDLNNFKGVNDRFGHVAGDDLLRQFAVELRIQFTSPDMVGRWGGDEFVALLSGTLKDAEEKTDRIRGWALGEYKIPQADGMVTTVVNAAIGAVEWDGAEAGLELLKRVDRYVYRAKTR